MDTHGMMNKYIRPKRVETEGHRRARLGVSQGSPFKGTMAHKLEFWKEGHARRKLGDSSQRAARSLLLFASIVIFWTPKCHSSRSLNRFLMIFILPCFLSCPR